MSYLIAKASTAALALEKFLDAQRNQLATGLSRKEFRKQLALRVAGKLHNPNISHSENAKDLQGYVDEVTDRFF